MKTVQVTGGEVILRERADLTVRQRQQLQEQLAEVYPLVKPLQPFVKDGSLDEEKAFEAGMLTRAALHAFIEASQVLVVTAIESWTLTGPDGEPLPTPKTIEDAGDLKATVFDELSTEVGMLELLGEVNFEPSNPNAPGFEQTPTQPSAA